MLRPTRRQLVSEWVKDVVRAGTHESLKVSALRQLAQDYVGPLLGFAAAEIAQKPDQIAEARRAVDRLAWTGGPIVAGPWLSEVGFELLYWVPFLRWVRDHRPDLADRLVILSRGGVAHWYEGISSTYVDVFDLIGLDEFVRGQAEARALNRGQKQFLVLDWERALVARAAARLGLGKVEVLHPSLMYQVVRQLGKVGSVPRMQQIASYRLIAPPEPGPLAGVLPEEYVAVKFYFNDSFPDTGPNQRFIAGALRALTDRTNVVLLNTGLRLDEHADYEMLPSERLFRIDLAMEPRTNLQLQTIAIGRARAFVGTYGGLSYLAPMLGVASLALYSDPEKFFQHHLDAAQRIFRGPAWGPFVALDTAHLGLVRLAYAATPGVATVGQAR